MKVRLKKALTKYHPTLIEGLEGVAIGPYGNHSRNNPKTFVGVRFPEITLDVMLKDLDRVELIAPSGWPGSRARRPLTGSPAPPATARPPTAGRCRGCGPC